MIIDTFLESLAEAKGKKSIAIILSGNGSDGSKGVLLIKHSGDLVIAQTPGSCKFSPMSSNVVKTGAVEFVLERSRYAKCCAAACERCH